MVTSFTLSQSFLGVAGGVAFDFRGILHLLQGFCFLCLITFNCTSFGHSISLCTFLIVFVILYYAKNLFCSVKNEKIYPIISALVLLETKLKNCLFPEISLE